MNCMELYGIVKVKKKKSPHQIISSGLISISCPWLNPSISAPRYGSRCCPCHRHVSLCQRPSAHLLRHLQNGKKKWKHPQWPVWPIKKKVREKKSPASIFSIFCKKQGSILRGEVSTCRHLNESRCLYEKAGRSISCIDPWKMT